MRRKIPSTAALIAFESAARHQSFTRAAEELSLTQSAICRQVAGLEAFLNVELFRRSRRGVKLTEAGLSYSSRVAAQLDSVERDYLALIDQQGMQSLRGKQLYGMDNPTLGESFQGLSDPEPVKPRRELIGRSDLTRRDPMG